jgi:outer membrane phospholipase A
MIIVQLLVHEPGQRVRAAHNSRSWYRKYKRLLKEWEEYKITDDIWSFLSLWVRKKLHLEKDQK